jgi:hypothetical protein
MILLAVNLEKFLIFCGKISNLSNSIIKALMQIQGLACFDSFWLNGSLDERWGHIQHPTRSGDNLKPAANAK